MRHFFTGPAIKTDLLLVWLEKHGIEASARPADGEGGGVGEGAGEVEDLSREMEVLVADADYERAHQLFFSDREDEI